MIDAQTRTRHTIFLGILALWVATIASAVI